MGSSVLTDENSHRNARFLPQFLVACAANLCAFAMGTCIGWAAPALPQLSNEPLSLDKSEVSWVGSALNLGGMLGGISGGWLIGTFGRRKTLLLIAPMYLLGIILMGSAVNFAMLLSGRIITGMAGGISSIVGPVYVSEIATPKYRGLLCSMFSLMLASGILFIYVIGGFLSWWIMTLITAVIPMIAFVLVLAFVPETPTFLLSKNKEYEAKKSLSKIRRDDCSAEFQLLVGKKTGETSDKATFKISDLLKGPVIKPTFICIMLMFFQQMCGINAAMFNLGFIFQATGSTLDKSLQVIVIGVFQLGATAIGSVIVDKAGRKILLTASGIVMGIAMMGLGTYFYLLGVDVNSVTSLSWLPLVSLCLFSVFFSIGFGPLAWTVMGEILPEDVKGVASALVGGFCWGLAFVTTLTYEPLVELLSQAGAFYFYGAFSLLGAIYVLVCLPETTGKTLQEIQKLFE